MKLLMLGKCPPIQGGVSWQTFRTCLELARRGHEVHLLTNADEVEPGFKQVFLPGDTEYALGLHQPGFQRRDLIPLTSFGHIPQSPAYGSRLFGKALDIARAVRPDWILGWYFEPYGLAAAQVAQACGIPCGVIHAGSDLGRLALHPDLASAYAWMAGVAAVVLTVQSEPIAARLDQLDVAAAKRRHLKGFEPLHDSYDNPASLDFAELSQAAVGHFAAYVPGQLLEQLEALNGKPLAPDVPVIGMYGKVGEAKGSYDLIAALADLAGRGVRFQFVALAAGPELEKLVAPILANPALARCCWVLPPIAPWRVSGFLRRCDIACFLERGFGISFHWPIVPLEVLASSVCLLCSREIVAKPLYDHLLRHEQTCFVIDDPRDVPELAGRLEVALTDVEARDRLAQRGYLRTTTLRQQLVKNQLCRYPVADAIEALATT